MGRTEMIENYNRDAEAALEISGLADYYNREAIYSPLMPCKMSFCTGLVPKDPKGEAHGAEAEV